ncbi:hypothetical protein [Alienimonas chondri]|uniref:Secreted protein n=1 Tax=Alienimonas chondri TaxID=2681879 RepID=A0ABX1VDJ7_9PLAN|nr:hypothetical protein [Alienimonas chondri]NNJ25774.1 hypothetical protein [Alienimonas chondri]
MFARLLSAAALAAVLAVPQVAAAGHCSGGSCYDSGYSDHEPCRYEWVTKYRTKLVTKYKHVVKYDHCDEPYLAKVAYRARVRVPYRVRVKVCH